MYTLLECVIVEGVFSCDLITAVGDLAILNLGGVGGGSGFGNLLYLIVVELQRVILKLFVPNVGYLSRPSVPA